MGLSGRLKKPQTFTVYNSQGVKDYGEVSSLQITVSGLEGLMTGRQCAAIIDMSAPDSSSHFL